MKVKTIRVGVMTGEELIHDAKSFMGKLARGEKPAPETGVFFENLSAMRKALTGKRLEIVRTIKKEKPRSVYALAKSLGRDLRSVIKDLEFLEDVGLVDLKKSSEGKERTEPRVDYDIIDLKIAV